MISGLEWHKFIGYNVEVTFNREEIRACLPPMRPILAVLIIATNSTNNLNNKNSKVNKIINKYLVKKNKEYAEISGCYQPQFDSWYDENHVCYDEFDLEPELDKVVHDVYEQGDMMVDWYDDSFCGDFYNPSITLAAGEIFLIKNNYDLAKKILTMAMKRTFDAHYPYAILCFKLGLIDEAIEHFKIAAREEVDACLILSELCKKSEAVNYINIYNQLKSSRPNFNSVGMYYLFLTEGNYDHAYVRPSVEYLNKAVRKEDVGAMNNLGKLYHELKRYSEAEEMLCKASSKGSSKATVNLQKLYADPNFCKN